MAASSQARGWNPVWNPTRGPALCRRGAAWKSPSRSSSARRRPTSVLTRGAGFATAAGPKVAALADLHGTPSSRTTTPVAIPRSERESEDGTMKWKNAWKRALSPRLRTGMNPRNGRRGTARDMTSASPRWKNGSRIDERARIERSLKNGFAVLRERLPKSHAAVNGELEGRFLRNGRPLGQARRQRRTHPPPCPIWNACAISLGNRDTTPDGA